MLHHVGSLSALLRRTWFTEYAGNTIGYVTPQSMTATEFTNTAHGITSNAAPVGITVGPDGNIWFAERGVPKVAKFVW